MKSSSSALVQQPSVEMSVTIISGPKRGSTYRLVSGRVRFGRGADNDIVVEDAKCSRHHAEILVGPRGIEVRDVSDRNQIIVNGNETKAAYVHDNSVFVLGDTQFRLNVRAPSAPVPLAAAAPWPQNLPGPQGIPPRPNPQSRQPKKAKPNYTLWVIVGAVILWLITSGDGQPKQIKSSTEIAENELETIRKLNETGQSRRPKDVSVNDIGYNQAQQLFVSGFRDYKKGQYERALASFQACVSLHPQHNLCTRYRRLTERRLDEMIQYHMVLGKKYRDQNQFSACASAFRNVMVMVKDPNNKRYQEAKANYQACQSQLEERF